MKNHFLSKVPMGVIAWICLVAMPFMLQPSELDDILASLPEAGFGFLSYVDNGTPYNANAKPSGDATIHDSLPVGSEVFIKSLAQEGAYFTVQKIDKQPTITLEVIDPTKDLAAKARATFTVHRRLSYDLSDWIGFSHADAGGLLLAIDPDSGDIGITQKEQEFKQEEFKNSHWKIIGRSLGNCCIQNRSNGGCLYFFKGKKDVVVKPKKAIPNTDVWTVTGDYEKRQRWENAPIKYGTKVSVWSNKANREVFQAFIRNARGQDADQAVRFGDTISLYNPSNTRYLSAGWRWETDWWVLEGDRQRWIVQDQNHGGQGEITYGNTFTLRTAFGPWYFSVNPDGSLWHANDRPDWQPIRFLNPRGHVAGVWLDSYETIYKSASVSSLTIPGGTDFAQTTKKPVSTSNVILTQVALKDTDDSWGVDKSNILYHFDGKAWKREGDRKAKSVSISSEGHVWYVVDDPSNKLAIMHGIPDPAKKKIISWIPVKAEETGAQAFVSQASAYKDGCYFILGNSSKGGMVYFYNGIWEDTKFPNADKDPAVSISAAPDGTVWAITKNGKLLSYDSTTQNRKWVSYTPPAGSNLAQVAARSKNDVWVVDQSKRALWHLADETEWTRQERCGAVDYVACAAGYEIIPAVLENKYVELASTKDNQGRTIAANNPQAQVAIEIAKLGQGGGIPPRSGISFNLLPLTKRPHVTGFTSQEFAELNPKNFLKVHTLLSIGTAWLNTAMKTPGRCTVSFLSRAKNSGDVQVVFGQNPNDNFVWRIAFGAQNNQGATITRRTFKDGVPQDEIVCKVLASQSPFAAIVPGEWQAYWVSLDDGLILVGAGDPGANIFMAWRDPSPPSDVNYIGFGSHKQDVEFTQISKTDESINAQAIARFYKTFTAVKPQAVVPFRVQEEGTIGFMTVDANPISLTLSPEDASVKEHYMMRFDSVRGITINKFNGATNKYERRAELSKKVFPDVDFSTQSKYFWICYDEGNLFIGDQDIAQRGVEPRILLAFQDPKPIKGVRNLRLAEGNIRSATAMPPIILAMGKKKAGYQLLSKALPFSGGVTIVFPFDYQFSQNRQQVFIENLVAMTGPRPVAAIPQQGAQYNFRFSIGEHGEPGMVLMEAPKNHYMEAINRAIVKAEAKMQLLATEGDIEVQRGAIEQAKKFASANQFRAGAASMQDVGRQLVSAGTELMGKGGTVGMVAGGIAAGAGQAAIAGSQALIQVAAAKEYEGEMAVAAGQERALRKQEQVAQLAFETAVGRGSVETAFRSHDSYAFVEQVQAPKLASVDIPEEAKQNQAALADLLQQAMVQPPTIEQVQYMLDLITHYYVISNPANRKQLQSIIDKLCERERANVDAYHDMINLLFTAYNNAFLLDENVPQEANRKAQWLAQINRFARTLLQDKKATFTINNYFGEYVWLPVTLPSPGSALFTFSVRGRNDFFVCFSPDYGKRIRNSRKELYEIVLGGWDGSKSALRIESLGHSVQEVGVDDKPMSALNDIDFVPVWININNGRITVGRGAPGENIFLDWVDPYPSFVNYIGLSSWNSQIEFKDWSVAPALNLAQKPTPAPKMRRSLAVTVGVTKKPLSDAGELRELEEEVAEEIAKEGEESEGGVEYDEEEAPVGGDEAVEAFAEE